MKNHKNLQVIVLGLLVAALMGCNIGSTPTPLVTAPPAVTSGPTAITHTVIPIDLPAERTNNAGDQDSSVTAKNKEANGGDRFTRGEYERAFNATTMDVYFPDLDIIDTETYQDEIWIFGSIALKGHDPNDQFSGKYALELDFDADGRGDWLILVSKPASTDWTVDRVEVWQDTNKDVGGTTPMSSDNVLSTGDGYDVKVFDGGQGNDPDTAWARILPTNPLVVQLAVKRSLFEADDKYLASFWAAHDALIPAQFDFNDHMTHEQAGAAVHGFEIFYPIKGLSELDNTCKVAVGFVPSGTEPGLCKTLIPTQPGEPGASNKCPNVCSPQETQEPYPACGCIPG